MRNEKRKANETYLESAGLCPDDCELIRNLAICKTHYNQVVNDKKLMSPPKKQKCDVIIQPHYHSTHSQTDESREWQIRVSQSISCACQTEVREYADKSCQTEAPLPPCKGVADEYLSLSFSLYLFFLSS